MVLTVQAVTTVALFQSYPKIEEEDVISRLLIAMVGVFLFAQAALAGSITNWELVYEHDSSGVATSGSIETLISAVRTGADVKVVQHSGISGDWSRTIEKVNVSLSTPPIVTGYYSEYNPLTNDPQDTVIYERLTTMSTTGEVSARYVNTSIQSQYLRYRLSWYVNR